MIKNNKFLILTSLITVIILFIISVTFIPYFDMSHFKTLMRNNYDFIEGDFTSTSSINKLVVINNRPNEFIFLNNDLNPLIREVAFLYNHKGEFTALDIYYFNRIGLFEWEISNSLKGNITNNDFNSSIRLLSNEGIKHPDIIIHEVPENISSLNEQSEELSENQLEWIEKQATLTPEELILENIELYRSVEEQMKEQNNSEDELELFQAVLKSYALFIDSYLQDDPSSISVIPEDILAAIEVYKNE